MLQPSRTNLEKLTRDELKEGSTRCLLKFWVTWITSFRARKVTSRQIEAARVALTRQMQRKGRVGYEFFQIFQFQKSQLKSEWVKVRDLLNFGCTE
jgi:large subunit ribosomal protein L16